MASIPGLVLDAPSPPVRRPGRRDPPAALFVMTPFSLFSPKGGKQNKKKCTSRYVEVVLLVDGWAGRKKSAHLDI